MCRSHFTIRVEHPTVRIEAAPLGRQPFPVEAVIQEEDTYLVLSAAPVLSVPDEHPLQLLQAVHDAEPMAPGSVIVRPGVPLRLLAVVHDLAADPTWREEWVSAALDESLAVVGRRGIRAIAAPILGTVHGRLGLERGLELLRQALDHSAPACLKYLWLVVSPAAASGLAALVGPS